MKFSEQTHPLSAARMPAQGGGDTILQWWQPIGKQQRRFVVVTAFVLALIFAFCVGLGLGAVMVILLPEAGLLRSASLA